MARHRALDPVHQVADHDHQRVHADDVGADDRGASWCSWPKWSTTTAPVRVITAITAQLAWAATSTPATPGRRGTSPIGAPGRGHLRRLVTQEGRDPLQVRTYRRDRDEASGKLKPAPASQSPGGYRGSRPASRG